MNQNDVDRLLGSAQFRLSLIIIVSFVAAIGGVLFFVKDLTQTQTTVLTNLLSTLGVVFTLTANFWFARHRPQSASSDGAADGNGNGGTPPTPIAPQPGGQPAESKS